MMADEFRKMTLEIYVSLCTCARCGKKEPYTPVEIRDDLQRGTNTPMGQAVAAQYNGYTYQALRDGKHVYVAQGGAPPRGWDDSTLRDWLCGDCGPIVRSALASIGVARLETAR